MFVDTHIDVEMRKKNQKITTIFKLIINYGDTNGQLIIVNRFRLNY